MIECFMEVLEMRGNGLSVCKSRTLNSIDNIISFAIPFREVDFICDDPFWEINHLIIDAS